jgi:hypothetical protein
MPVKAGAKNGAEEVFKKNSVKRCKNVGKGVNEV